MGRWRYTLIALVAVAVGIASVVLAGSVAGTKHDLSTNFDQYSNRVCVYCHTPHFANTTLSYQAPLWNRYVDVSKTFTPYSSDTMDTTPGDVRTTVSILCLGCHDGTLGTAVVNGYTGSDKHDLVNAPGPGGIPDTTSWPNCERCHPDKYHGGPPVQWIGTDLSNDHPITISYPTPSQDPDFTTPPDPVSGWSDVPLYDGRIECPTCHEPHDATYAPFLRMDNQNSALCTRCHVK